MRKSLLVKTQKGYEYLYSESFNCILLLHPALARLFANEDIIGYDSDTVDYYKRKFNFLVSKGVNDSAPISFVTRPDVNEIKLKLANLRQLTFEITDNCNLNCHYCGYGSMYSNYDTRTTGNMSMQKVRNILNYMVDIWNSSFNLSFNNIVDISFYGGEPLMNIKLIKDTISYLTELDTKNLRFTYRMTTNAVLLDLYMDFLVSKNFNLLISIDGNKYANSYRVYKNGEQSYDKVLNNILKLREKYPSFYESNVSFNAVLHDRNSYEDIFLFMKNVLGKTGMISELSDGGIRSDKVEEFKTMFKPIFKEREHFFDKYSIYREYETSGNAQLRSLVHGYTGNMYKTLNSLIKPSKSVFHMPSGTCIAFYKKVFVTVNGKIFPCEKIGQNYPVGYVDDSKVILDFEKIASFYDNMYKPLLKLCKQCYHQRNCSQCVFNIYDKCKSGKLKCPTFVNKSSMINYLRMNLDYLENKPDAYEKLLETDFVY